MGVQLSDLLPVWQAVKSTTPALGSSALYSSQFMLFRSSQNCCWEREAGVPWWLVWPCCGVHSLFTATFIIFLQCITFSTLSLSPSSLSLCSLSSLFHCLHHSHHHCLFHQILVLCICKLIIRVVGSVQWPVGCWWVPQNSCSLVSLYPNKNFPIS